MDSRYYINDIVHFTHTFYHIILSYKIDVIYIIDGNNLMIDSLNASNALSQ